MSIDRKTDGSGVALGRTLGGVTPRSGTPYTLRFADSKAEIAGDGATLRSLRFGDVAILDGFDVDHFSPAGAGQVLAPWPNRLADGRYIFEGVSAAAPINEVEKNNAIHGLVRWSQWQPVVVGESDITLESVIVPQPAYPWRLRLQVAYQLAAESLTVRFTAHNEDDRTAPFAIGFHPYFLAEGGEVDRASISVRAGEHLLLDDRALPCGSESVVGGPYGAIVSTGGLSLSGVALDDCFTAIERSSEPTVATFHPGPDSRPVTITLGHAFTHLMCFTGDTLSPPRRRRAVALEPMTCAPNALASGIGVATVAPGSAFGDAFVIEHG